MSEPDRDAMAALAATRFGLGARPGEIAAARGDPKAFLLRQIRPQGADQPSRPLPDSAERLGEFQRYRADAEARRTAQGANDQMQEQAVRDVEDAQRRLYAGVGDEFLARMTIACTTEAAFRERWTMFWANWFTVSATSLPVAATAGPFEREAIRPRVFGTFEELLVAATRHPAMLAYLDQAQSTGPNSRLGRRRDMGLNENLAREILELHTVGVEAGYAQADVTEFAKALTGWSVGRPREPEAVRNRFVFREVQHEPGARTVMGRTYSQDGVMQAYAVLKDLAAHPSTARRAARRIAAHFVSDTPPPALVARLERAWISSGGRLDRVAAVLIEAPEAWDPAFGKFKTPYEFLVSSFRLIGRAPERVERIGPVLNQLGQRPFTPPSPKGWPDEEAAWASPDALLKRLEWAQAFAGAVAPMTGTPADLAREALGERLSPRTLQFVSRAEDRAEGLAILLMSPEFQRR